MRSHTAPTNPAGRLPISTGSTGNTRAVTIKLDKAGRLTAALALAAVAKRRGLRIVVGGTIGTSLGIVPALLVAQGAEIVDFDGPLHLVADRVPGLRYEGSTICPAEVKVWGEAG